jgi:hypothetical protein
MCICKHFDWVSARPFDWLVLIPKTDADWFLRFFAQTRSLYKSSGFVQKNSRIGGKNSKKNYTKPVKFLKLSKGLEISPGLCKARVTVCDWIFHISG